MLKSDQVESMRVAMHLTMISASIAMRASVVWLSVSTVAFAFSDEVYPKSGVNAAGYNWFPPLSNSPIQIQVDKSAERLLVIQDNRIVGVSIISIGTEERPTPRGTFTVTQKIESHVSKEFQGVRMPYSIFIGSDGYAIHAGDLSSSSAGCIRVPLYFAEVLFEYVEVGDTVKIFEGSIP
jgi:L,D-transpeptidase catalytic domain